jgi:thiaminase (transcriptional activator TenA)
MNWSNKTWEQIQPIYQSIIKMPFIAEMMKGTLALERFQFYIAQDSHYLEHFGRSLSIIAARIQNIKDSLAFIRFAEGAIIVENALHESYFKDFNLTDKGIMQPSCHHYAHFLKSIASLGSVEVAVAAVLPCFWIYKEVGDYIYKNQQPINNPYQKWIDTYSGEEFNKVVQQAITICDSLASSCTKSQQHFMTKAFITSSQLEFQFWDSAYHLRKW